MNPFFRAADIQVGLRHIQFDLAARLQIGFFRRGKVRFRALYFSRSGAAVIERPAHAAGDFPVFIFKAREIFVLPAHVGRQRDGRFIAGLRDIQFFFTGFDIQCRLLQFPTMRQCIVDRLRALNRNRAVRQLIGVRYDRRNRRQTQQIAHVGARELHGVLRFNLFFPRIR